MSYGMDGGDGRDSHALGDVHVRGQLKTVFMIWNTALYPNYQVKYVKILENVGFPIHNYDLRCRHKHFLQAGNL